MARLDDVLGRATAAEGLTATEALRLLREHGPNALPEVTPTPLWLRFVRQFLNPLISRRLSPAST
ncbi:MAG TPA: cation-transporting P-type ATPase [Polyangiaceae bacterium]